MVLQNLYKKGSLVKNKIWIILFVGMFFSGCKCKKTPEKERMCSRVDVERVVSLLPQTVAEVNVLGESSKQVMNDMILNLETVKAKNRTFGNTIRPYEVAKFNFLMNKNIITVLSLLSCNSSIQAAAHVQALSLDAYESDVLMRNVSLYQAFKEYAVDGPDVYCKRGANQQFLQKKIHAFEKQGLLLPFEQRVDMTTLDKEANKLAAQFNGNIIYDTRSIIVSAKDLSGLPEFFMKTLQRDAHNDYILPIDFDTFFTVMENCESEKVRKEYFIAFGQRAYPQNKHVLQELLQKRHKFAKMLGFADFASYELSDQMIQDPKKVEKFLWQTVEALQKYDDRDFAQLIEILPPSVVLTKDKKLKPWDEAFVKSAYRKKHFSVDDYNLAAYFPLDYVLQKMLQIFSSFFYIEFKKEDVAPDQLWGPDVICYRVYSLHNQMPIGYLFLDLYKHAYKKVQEPCHFMLIPTIKDDCSIRCVGASVMVANFAEQQVDKPTLLEFSDVTSLFHELGHALHALFGAACFVDYSGTQVVKDFVEVPSQMLEYWLEDPAVLQTISKHYQTGNPLSRELIEQILAAQKFGGAGRMLKQAFLGLVSLYVYRDGHQEDLHKAIEKLYKKVFKNLTYEPNFFFEYSFAHLANYGVSYYTYIWSRMIAADLFSYIQLRGGILNSDIGKEYVKEILSHGGFINPWHMLKKFLKRPFNKQVFFQQFENKPLA